MKTPLKYNLILDALQELLKEKDIQKISVNDIAKKAGIGKGSIYYYFPSKDAIIDALIEKNYKLPLETAKEMVQKKELSPYYRIALIFRACQNSSKEFLQHRRHMRDDKLGQDDQEQAYIHQKYMKYIISELKPSLTEIIQQEIDEGLIKFDYPEQLAEIVLIVLTIKLDNTLVPSTSDEIEQCIRALIALLENCTGIPVGVLDYLTKI